MNNLPNDVLLYIIAYTYSPQKSELLNDMKNFHDTKHQVIKNYTSRESELDPYEWIMNDIFRFANEYQPTIYGFTNNFMNIFLRNPRISRETFTSYIEKFESMSCTQQINIFLSLLTIHERNNFIESFLNK